MKVTLSKSSKKFVSKLNQDKFKKQITIKIKQLAANGHLNDSKRLNGKLSDYHRTDVGEFRIIYKIEGENLLIDAIGKRNDDEIYKSMKRKLN